MRRLPSTLPRRPTTVPRTIQMDSITRERNVEPPHSTFTLILANYGLVFIAPYLEVEPGNSYEEL